MRQLLLLPFLLIISQQLSAQCLGDPALCNKTYDEVCVVMTHNAFNYEGDFFLPNQTYTISRQMEDGVRGLMLDVYTKDNETVVYHGVEGLLGFQPLDDLMDSIKVFLDANPTEIISIIFEAHVPSTLIETSINNVGLIPYLFHPSASWPTLQEMIDNNERLVVFSEMNDALPSQDWYMYIWDHAVETHFSVDFVEDFTCEFNRGDASNDLFLMNHFVTLAANGIGQIDSATIINQSDFLLDRVQQCYYETGRVPNFIGIDFHEQGDAFIVADSINSMSFPTSFNNLPKPKLSIYPNPVQDQLNIDYLSSTNIQRLEIYNLNGRLIGSQEISGNKDIILTANLNPGVYILSFFDELGLVQSSRLVKY